MLILSLSAWSLLGITPAPENTKAHNFALAAVTDLEAGNQSALSHRLDPRLRPQIDAAFAQM